MLSAKSKVMTSSHDAKTPFGIEAPQCNRKHIHRHKLYSKTHDGRCQPYWKTCQTHGPKYSCRRNYYDTILKVTELISGIMFAFGMCFDHVNNTQS